MSRKSAVLRKSDGEQPGSTNHGPGPRLRDGRLARSMTLEEAAELLKLDPSVLASLERDDFTALPETLYVRGYLTSYARLLGIPEQEIVHDYRAFRGEASAPTLSARRPIEEQAASGDTGLRWFSYGLMAGIVALVGWWGYQRLPLESPAATVVASGNVDPTLTAEPAPGPAAVQAVEPEIPAQVDFPAAPPSLESESTRVEVAAYTALPESAEDSSLAETPDAGRQGGLEAPELPQPDETAELPQQGPATAPSALDPESLAMDSGAPMVVGAETPDAELTAKLDPEDGVHTDVGSPLDILDLSFSRDCWVEVRDAQQQRLVYGLVKAGSFRRVEGEAPFRVLFGDSGAVEVRFNGETVARDLYDAGDGKPARFSLGEGQLETVSSP